MSVKFFTCNKMIMIKLSIVEYLSQVHDDFIIIEKFKCNRDRETRRLRLLFIFISVDIIDLYLQYNDKIALTFLYNNAFK